jgi:hypothetical protein
VAHKERLTWRIRSSSLQYGCFWRATALRRPCATDARRPRPTNRREETPVVIPHAGASRNEVEPCYLPCYQTERTRPNWRHLKWLNQAPQARPQLHSPLSHPGGRPAQPECYEGSGQGRAALVLRESVVLCVGDGQSHAAASVLKQTRFRRKWRGSCISHTRCSDWR